MNGPRKEGVGSGLIKYGTVLISPTLWDLRWILG